MIKAVRGTRDLLPPDTDLWNFVDRKVREVFARYNYREIRTPIFESPNSSPAASAKRPTSSARRCSPGRTRRAPPAKRR